MKFSTLTPYYVVESSAFSSRTSFRMCFFLFIRETRGSRRADRIWLQFAAATPPPEWRSHHSRELVVGLTLKWNEIVSMDLWLILSHIYIYILIIISYKRNELYDYSYNKWYSNIYIYISVFVSIALWIIMKCAMTYFVYTVYHMCMLSLHVFLPPPFTPLRRVFQKIYKPRAQRSDWTPMKYVDPFPAQDHPPKKVLEQAHLTHLI